MRLLIVGTLNGQLTTASRMAMDRGAKVVQADDADAAMTVLRAGRGADLVMAETRTDIAGLIRQLEEERIHVPVVACGIESDARAAVAAIRAGAKEYIPLPPDPDLLEAQLLPPALDDRGKLGPLDRGRNRHRQDRKPVILVLWPVAPVANLAPPPAPPGCFPHRVDHDTPLGQRPDYVR